MMTRFARQDERPQIHVAAFKPAVAIRRMLRQRNHRLRDVIARLGLMRLRNSSISAFDAFGPINMP
jgi:hypothetical protein